MTKFCVNFYLKYVRVNALINIYENQLWIKINTLQAIG